MEKVVVECAAIKQRTHNFLLASIKAGILIKISYAAQRGISTEPGAVQRLLNPNRIASIKKFTLDNGNYPGSIVLNWMPDKKLVRNGATVEFDIVEKSAQIIDGQHRLAGIAAAIEENQAVSDIELPVSIYIGLTTQQCADIFLSINTEQKPVPRSLVFDLYGIASNPVVDKAAQRALDIANGLNEEDDSPYFNNIKKPGDPKRKGGIALSTAVTALKPLVEAKGQFEQLGLNNLGIQKTIVLNYFKALQALYGSHWDSPKSVFQYAAGFAGAVDFFRTKLLPYCQAKKSFAVRTIQDAIRMSYDNIILQEEVKGLGGKDAPRKVAERLTDLFTPTLLDASDFEV